MSFFGETFGRQVLMTSAAAVAIAFAGPALAQAKSFNVTAQAAETGIPEFARQADCQILVSGAAARGKRVNLVHGTFSVQDGLARLLAGSGLTVASNDGHTILLQESGGNDPAPRDPPPAEEKKNTVAEVVVTANKRAENIHNVGEGISAVTSDQLDTLQANSLADYLQLIPGVAVQSFGAPGYGMVEIRGVSPQTPGATVATYIDDIPVGGSTNTAESGEFTPDLDPADLQRVEVLKGPQGTLYGASSLGGVIKYVTKQPSLTEPQGAMSEEIEDVDHGGMGGKVRGSYSTPVTDDFAVRVSGYYRWIPGYIDDIGFAGKDANSGTAWGLRGTALWKPTDNLTIDLNAMTQQARQNGYNTVDFQETATGPIFEPLYGDLKELRYDQEYFQYRTDLVSAEINYQTPYGTLLSATGYSKITPSQQQDETKTFEAFGLASPSNPVAAQAYHIDEQETEELRFTSNRIGNLEFIGGGFLQHEAPDQVTSYVTYENGGRVVDPTAPNLDFSRQTGTLDEVAGFANATYYITPSLDLTLGYRYADIRQFRDSVTGGLLATGSSTGEKIVEGNTDGTPSSYLAGLRWRLNDDVMFYLRAASGYRPGGVRPAPPGAPANFPTFYVSDSIWSYEAGVKIKGFDDRLTFDADAYQIDWSNIQTLIYVGPFNVAGNGGAAVSKGVELQATYIPVTGLTLNANGAWTDAYFKTTDPTVNVTAGEPLYFVPRLTGDLGATYSWPVGRYQASVGGDVNYQGRQYDVSEFALAAYTLVNVRAGLQWDRYAVNIFVKNLFDKRAIVGDGGFTSGFPYIATVNQPMTVGLSFSQRF